MDDSEHVSPERKRHLGRWVILALLIGLVTSCFFVPGLSVAIYQGFGRLGPRPVRHWAVEQLSSMAFKKSPPDASGLSFDLGPEAELIHIALHGLRADNDPNIRQKVQDTIDLIEYCQGQRDQVLIQATVNGIQVPVTLTRPKRDQGAGVK